MDPMADLWRDPGDRLCFLGGISQTNRPNPPSKPTFLTTTIKTKISAPTKICIKQNFPDDVSTEGVDQSIHDPFKIVPLRNILRHKTMMKFPLISRLELCIFASIIGIVYGVTTNYFGGFSRQSQPATASLISQAKSPNCQQIQVAQYRSED
jgi:hypothetical protein